MNSKELVSIIIPCYNQAEYLEEAVQSVLEQTYQPIEIIIVNDGSTDKTETVARDLELKHPDIIQVHTQTNSGLSAARNAGIKKASGNYIVPLDSDDFLNEKMIEYSMLTLIEHDADIVYAGYKLFGSINRKNYLKPFYKNIILYWNVCSATALYKKEVWEIIGGYKENMHGGYEDWEFWINAYKHNFVFQHRDEILWHYRRKEISMVTDAKEKDEYLRAKIVMNHPELYTIDYTQKATQTIIATENLPDLYFYYLENSSIPNKQTLDSITTHVNKGKLKDKQVIYTDDKHIGLFNLNLLTDQDTIPYLQKDLNCDLIVLYSTLRHNIPHIVTSEYTWCKSRGILPLKGTVFPYVYTNLRNNKKMQYTAHRRLFCYQQILLTNTGAEKMKNLNDDIKNLITYSIIRHPYKKYTAYKKLIKTYYITKKMKKLF